MGWIVLLLAGGWTTACDNGQIAGKPVVDETRNGFQATIRLPDGRPAARATARIFASWQLAGAPSPSPILLEADGEGRIEIPHLAAGSHWIEVRSGSSGIRIAYPATQESFAEAHWELERLGQVLVAASPGSLVRAYGSDRTWTADASGKVLLDSLPPGPWAFRSDSIGSGDPSLLGENSVEILADQTAALDLSKPSPMAPSTWKHSWNLILEPNPAASAETLANFPLPIRIHPSLFADGLGNPDDLRLTNSHGDELGFDVESWDSATGALIWTSLPFAHPLRGDTLTLLWGKPGLGSHPRSPIADSTYGIWRFGGTDPWANAVASGPRIASDTATTEVEGLFGKARSVDRLSAMRLPPPSESAMERAFTISCWVHPEVAQHRFAKIFDLGGGGSPFGTALFDLDSLGDRPAFQMAFADGNWQRLTAGKLAGTWIFLAASWNGTTRTARFFVDGLQAGEFHADPALHSYAGHDLILGNQEGGGDGFAGILDEFRFDLAVRSPAWIRHEWFSRQGRNATLEPRR